MLYNCIKLIDRCSSVGIADDLRYNVSGDCRSVEEENSSHPDVVEDDIVSCSPSPPPLKGRI